MARPIKKLTYDKTVGFRISSEMHRKIFEMSLKTDCSLSDILTQLVEYGLDYIENGEQQETINNDDLLQLQEENNELKKIIAENKNKFDQIVINLQEENERLKTQNSKTNEIIRDVKPELLDIQTMNVLNVVAKKLSNKLKREISISDIVKNYVMRYNIEERTLWFHDFVLNANDIKDATGVDHNQILKNLPKI